MSKEAALNMMQPQATPPPTPEPTATATPTPPNADDKLQALIAKETKLQKEREQLKLEREQLNQEREKIKPITEKWQQFEDLKSKDKIEALKLVGFTEEDIVNYIANKPEPVEPTPAEIAAKAAQDEVEKLRKEMTEKETKAQKERDEKNINAFKEGIGQTIKKDAEKFEFLNHHGSDAQELVYETILEFMKEDQELLPMDAMKKALDSVEAFYGEQAEQLLSLKKLAPKLQKTEPVPEKTEPVKKTVVETKPVIPARPNPTPVKPPQGETREQKRARLENMLRNGG